MTDAVNWPGMAMIPEYARNDLDRLGDQWWQVLGSNPRKLASSPSLSAR